jgi:molecular chaperone DnaK (HSP70)
MSDYFGIDLGTSNCAIARATDAGLPEILPITQVINASGIGERPLLPSSLYISAAGEFPDGGPQLPWQQQAETHSFLGTIARDRGALQPDRLIASAKSWLCHPHADRRGPILPWGSTAVEKKLSPLEVSRELLSHLLANIRAANPAAILEHAVITVPASFDEVARALTLEAATQAGLSEVTLLEEPQAAFYAWIENQGTEWRKQVKSGDLLLVCDIGGGTADFSLIAVTEKDGNLALERIAVGEHLLLGGDNMDLALAHAVSEKLVAAGTTLDDWQFLALVQAVRAAKEALLSNPALPETPLSIPSRGSRLIASTISAVLTRDDVQQIAVDGFFPIVGNDEMPILRRAGGLRESGLPYAADAAISKHLARFLSRAKANTASSTQLIEAIGGSERLDRSPLLLPDAVLFNGGVFNASALRQRVLEQLSQWAGTPIRELEGSRPDHAVALGAAAYARLRATGEGLRIKSGTARSYYIGMECQAAVLPQRRSASLRREWKREADSKSQDRNFFSTPAKPQNSASSNPKSEPAISPAKCCPMPQNSKSPLACKLKSLRPPDINRARKSPSASKHASPNSATSNSTSSTQPRAKTGNSSSMSACSRQGNWTKQ